MAYSLENRLVIGVSSSAVFNLSESDQIFRNEGEEKYRIHQEKNSKNPLEKGYAFNFIERILSLNSIGADPERDPLVEVILLSKNDPDTGLRVMTSIAHYGLKITRAIFMQGHSPYEYISALNISLFLSGNKDDVVNAIKDGFPAGHVLDSPIDEHDKSEGLRIAFDFDGVLADDESESVMHNGDLKEFHQHEEQMVMQPHKAGPLHKFLLGISKIQKIEEENKKEDKTYKNKIRISIVTARNAPSHERAIRTIKNWGVMVNDAFFLGGIEKSSVLKVLSPHIFFDDQQAHLSTTKEVVPSVHIPFGIKNGNLDLVDDIAE